MIKPMLVKCIYIFKISNVQHNQLIVLSSYSLLRRRKITLIWSILFLLLSLYTEQRANQAEVKSAELQSTLYCYAVIRLDLENYRLCGFMLFFEQSVTGRVNKLRRMSHSLLHLNIPETKVKMVITLGGPFYQSALSRL